MLGKKILGTAFLAGVAALGLTSCGKDDASVIQFYTSMGDEPRKLLDPMVEEFNSKQDTYKVEVVNPGGGYDGVKNAVNAAIQGDKQPAIAYCYADHVAEYLPTGKVVNMMDFIKDPEVGYSEEEIADFIPGFYKEGYEAFGKTEADNVMYTLPFSKSTEALYYNQSVMQELYGDAWEENLPKTWEDVWEIGRKLKSTKGYENWFVLGYDSESNWFITLAEQNGYDYTSATEPYYLFNNDNNVKMLEDLKKVYDEKLITTQTIYGAYTSELFTKSAKNKEGTLFSIGSTAGATHQDSDTFEVGVCSLPQVDPENPKSISQGPSLVMLDQGNDEKEKVAWLFVKELLDPEFQAAFAKAQGYMPVRISSREEATAGDGLIAETMKLAIDQMENYFVSPAFNGSNKAREQVGAALISVLKGTKSAKDALQDAYDEASF